MAVVINYNFFVTEGGRQWHIDGTVHFDAHTEGTILYVEGDQGIYHKTFL